MIDNVESRVRCLVAEFLGVDASDLGPEISLTDDLAADSLDLLELVLGLEGRFGIAIPEAVIDGMHRYGDLVDVVEALAAEQHAPAGAEAPLVWARVVPGPDHGEAPAAAPSVRTPRLRVSPGKAPGPFSAPPPRPRATVLYGRAQLAPCRAYPPRRRVPAQPPRSPARRTGQSPSLLRY
jgi:acyl carrier protein